MELPDYPPPAKRPLISIVVPLYNKANYFSATLGSVLNQTVKDWELLVVDNLSTDGGPDLVRACKDPRVNLLVCTKKGVSAARNSGIAASKGELLVFLDADDFLARDYLETQLETLRSAPEAGAAVCCYHEFADGSPHSTVKRPVDGAYSQARLVGSCIVFCPGPQHIFLVKRTVLATKIRWLEGRDVLLGEDTCFWFEVANQTRIVFNPAPVAYYRIWAPGSRFTNLSDPARLFAGIGGAVRQNLRFLASINRKVEPVQAEAIMRFNFSIYIAARRLGQHQLAEDALSEAKQWLNRYLEIADRPTRGMFLRNALGLRLFGILFGWRYRNRP